MNYFDITTCDVCNGEGVGVCLWVSGCDLRCEGCHGSHTWSPEYGKKFTKEAESLLFNELDKPYIKRLTVTGGHPLMWCNRQSVETLLKNVRERYGDTKEIWLYTGYVYGPYMDPESKRIIETYVDVLVDGPFVKELKDMNLPFRGSSNQRIIRIKDLLQ
jgi:anaerobic ribonucleoside-triphosphate reductase activating protein